MTEYDCLLLEHVLWSTPEVAPKIADWLLAQLAVDDGMKQVGVGWGAGVGGMGPKAEVGHRVQQHCLSSCTGAAISQCTCHALP